MYKPSTYLVVTYFCNLCMYVCMYVCMYETYFLQNWLPRWNQMLTQLRFIHNCVEHVLGHVMRSSQAWLVCPANDTSWCGLVVLGGKATTYATCFAFIRRACTWDAFGKADEPFVSTFLLA